MRDNRLDARFFCSKTSLHKMRDEFYKNVGSKFGLARSMKDVLRNQYDFFKKIVKIDKETDGVNFIYPPAKKGVLGFGGETTEEYVQRFVKANDEILKLARSAYSLTKICHALERENEQLKADNIALQNLLTPNEYEEQDRLDELFVKRDVRITGS